MTEQQFKKAAGCTGNSTYQATWLQKILIEHLDDGLLLSLVNHAIQDKLAFLNEMKKYGIIITPDRKITGETPDGTCRDEMFAAFDEIKFLKEVRTRLTGSIVATTTYGNDLAKPGRPDDTPA